MIYPAIAEHLVFKKGLTFTWLSKVNPILRYELDKLTFHQYSPLLLA